MGIERAGIGFSEQDMHRQGLSYSGWVRVVVVALASLATLFLETAREPLVGSGFLFAFNVWNVWYAIRLTRGVGHWFVGVDLVVIWVTCLAQPWIIAPDATAETTSWVTVAAGMILVTYPWFIRLGVLVTAVVTVTTAYLAGAALALPHEWVKTLPVGVWLVVETAMSYGLYRWLVRGARAADRAVERGQQVRRDAEVATARRADEREYLASLHDTASATLLVVGSGVLAERQQWLADQAARDLEVIGGPAALAGDEVDLVAMLRDVFRHTPLDVRYHAPESVLVPAVTAVALSHSTREALTNVVRHADVAEADVTVRSEDDTVVVEVTDNGRGFDPNQVHGHRYGVTRSLRERMARTGGGAHVFSEPGEGTRVRLEWRPSTTGITPETDATELFATRFLYGLRWAVICLNPFVLVGLGLPRILGSAHAYSSQALQLAVLGGFMAVNGWQAFAMWRGKLVGRARWPMVVAVFALSIVATQSVLPEYRLTAAHWSDGDAAWTLVPFLIEQPAVVFAGVLSGQYLMTFLHAVLGGSLTVSAASAINITIVTMALQLAVGFIAWLVRENAAPTAKLAREEELLRTADAVAEQLHNDRTERYAGLAETTVPLLAGLASGEFDPGDERVRRACSVEAARMRRLFAEDATVPDPLMHELRACMEVAERNGVSVSFATYGERPPIPTDVRRTLIEPAMAAVATARKKVRLTLTGSDVTVTVSVVSDCPPLDSPIVDTNEDISTSTMADGKVLWIQATWRSAPAAAD
ncbi:MAG: ATP-binding protein [Kibdelosporangium sp.]